MSVAPGTAADRRCRVADRDPRARSARCYARRRRSTAALRTASASKSSPTSVRSPRLWPRSHPAPRAAGCCAPSSCSSSGTGRRTSAEQARQYQEIVERIRQAGPSSSARSMRAATSRSPFSRCRAQDNPALGLRGIRASLWRPELLRAQLAAILAIRPRGRCRILLPMVNDAAEIETVRRLVRELAPASGGDPDIPDRRHDRDARRSGRRRAPRPARRLPVHRHQRPRAVRARDRPGAPAAGRRAGRASSRRAAPDRRCGLPAARAAGRGVAVCGALASDPDAAPLLVGLGVGELSAVPGAIPAVKDALRRWRRSTECRDLAARALAQDDTAAVRAVDATGERT